MNIFSAPFRISKIVKSGSEMRKDLPQRWFPLFVLLQWVLFMENGVAQNTTVPVNIGVVLHYNTSFGKMSLSCIPMALSDFYASHPNYRTRLALKNRDSGRDVVGAAAAGTPSMSFSLFLSLTFAVDCWWNDFFFSLSVD